MRTRYPVLRRRSFFSGRDSNLDDRPDIRWYGKELDQPSWNDPELWTIAYQLDGAQADDSPGNYLVFVILNADWHEQSVRLPDPGAGRVWRRAADTSLPAGEDFASEGERAVLSPQDGYVAKARSAVVLLAC